MRAKLNAAVNAVVAKPAVDKRLRGLGYEPHTLALADAPAFLQKSIETWGRMIRATGIAEEPPERPHRGAAHQRRGIGEQPLGLGRERGIAGIADRDQHVAHEAVAAGALDRRFREQRAEGRVVEPREIGERGARNASRAASFASRPACANLFQGQTARQSSQP